MLASNGRSSSLFYNHIHHGSPVFDHHIYMTNTLPILCHKIMNKKTPSLEIFYLLCILTFIYAPVSSSAEPISSDAAQESLIYGDLSVR